MFQKTKDADQRVANFNHTNVNIDHTHFQITVETAPNKGFYETTVQVSNLGVNQNFHIYANDIHLCTM